MNETLKLIKERISTNHFDTTRGLSVDEIHELVAYAGQAPSSYNLQHWRFVAVTEPEAKARLKALAYNQQKVEDASVTFIVLGDLRGYERMPEIARASVEAGLIDDKRAESWISTSRKIYAGNERFSRDEAIRGASLAAMTLMIAAQAKGLSSGPMIGFDPEGVKREFGIAERYLPVMLLTVGYPAPGNMSRKPRLDVDQILAFENGEPFPA